MIKFEPLSFEQANPLVSGLMSGQNIYKNSVINKYLPLTTQAEAASKLAYAQLMGPQFLAKLMGNPSLLANIEEPQKPKLLKGLVNAATGGASGAGFLNNNKVSEAFSNNPQPATNQEDKGFFNGILNSISKLFSNPQNQRNVNPQQGNLNNTYNQEQNMLQQPQKTFAENEAEYAKTVEQGKITGKSIGESVANMGDQYDAGLKLSDKFKTLGSLINDPEFRAMRSEIPFFQEEQLIALSKIGTPRQQEMIGKLRNTADEVIRDTLNTFTGTRLKGELDVSKNMKIKDSDTFNVMVGKLKSAMLYKDLNMQRMKIASDLMENKHISKIKAFQMADEKLNTKDTIANIEKELDYPVTITNKKTGEKMTIPVSKAREMGVPNV